MNMARVDLNGTLLDFAMVIPPVRGSRLTRNAERTLEKWAAGGAAIGATQCVDLGFDVNIFASMG